MFEACLISWCVSHTPAGRWGRNSSSDARVLLVVTPLGVQIVLLSFVEHVFIDVLHSSNCLGSSATHIVVLATFLQSAIVFIDVHFVIDFNSTGVVSRSALFSLPLLQNLLLGLSAENILKLVQFQTLVRSFPDALDEDATLISSLPILSVLLAVIADVAEFIHVSGNDGWNENVHMPILEYLDSLIFLQLEIVQMIVVNVNLVAQIYALSLLDLDQRVSAHEVRTLVSLKI